MGSALARMGQSGMDSASEIRLRPARSMSYIVRTLKAYHFITCLCFTLYKSKFTRGEGFAIKTE